MQEWEAYNAGNTPDKQGAAPIDPGPYISQNCTLKLSKTPDTGQPNTYWFGGATLIKQYGGTYDVDGSNVNYLSWLGPDIVAYEVCTCTTPSSPTCQHLGHY